MPSFQAVELKSGWSTLLPIVLISVAESLRTGRPSTRRFQTLFDGNRSHDPELTGGSVGFGVGFGFVVGAAVGSAGGFVGFEVGSSGAGVGVV